MNARYIQEGKSIDYTPTEAVAAGDVVMIGNLIGVAIFDIPAGAIGSVTLVGVFRVVKDTATAVTAGAKCYWKATDKKVVTVASGNTLLGYAVAAAAEADESVNIRLMGGAA